MEFKQYSSYKNSGVEWLGDVPEHWNLKRFCYLFAENKKKNIGLKETNVLSLSYGNIKEKKIDDNKGLLPESFETYQIIEPNDIVFRFTDLQNDKRSLRSAISKYHGIITSAYIAVKTKQNADFYNYLFRAYDLQKVFYSMGEGMRQSLKMDELNKMPVVLPSEDEQKRIVAFLNTETTRIDNLITKQEKLIELLEEQRKSIISHAVTKGLNPNAPMKDSGVEWLGEVPEHWDVAVVKRAFIVKLGKMLQPDQKDETDVIKKYLKASNLTWDGVKDIDNEMWFSKNDLKKLKLEIGDLLVAEGGDVGKSCIFDSNEEFYYQNSVNRVRGQKNNANKFLYYWLFTLKYSGYIDILCNKSTIAHFTAEKLNETILLLPDSVEQNEIIAYLERENGKINQLILKQQSLIEKLKEYRASIISHAVTGKIDVREFGA